MCKPIATYEVSIQGRPALLVSAESIVDALEKANQIWRDAGVVVLSQNVTAVKMAWFGPVGVPVKLDGR